MQTRLLLCPRVYFGFSIAEISGVSGKLPEFVEGDIEHDFQRVVPIDVDGFDELRYDHLLCGKCAIIVEVSPCFQLVHFLFFLRGAVLHFFER